MTDRVLMTRIGHRVLGFWALIETAALVVSFDPRFNGPLHAIASSQMSMREIRFSNLFEAASLVFAYFALSVHSALRSDSADSALNQGGTAARKSAVAPDEEGSGG